MSYRYEKNKELEFKARFTFKQQGRKRQMQELIAETN